VTFVALLLYAINPEAIFWQMQYVRQTLALALLTGIIYFLYLLDFEKSDKRYLLISIILSVTLVLCHHVTAFTSALFLFLFSILNYFSHIIGRFSKLRKFALPIRGRIFFVFGLFTFIVMLIWWSKNSSIIFPTIESRIVLFFENLGVERLYTQASTAYPSVLKPWWVFPLLGFRDLMSYGVAIFGLFIIWRSKAIPEKFFVVYSTIAFGLIVGINIVFKIEPLRIVMFMSPFMVFLSALFYKKTKIKILGKIVSRILLFEVLTLLIFSSFLGLWGHNFAPVHLYDPSIDPVQIGEGSPDFIKMKSFFENEINITEFQDVRADVISRLVYLLEPDDFDKIKSLPIENLDELNKRSTLVCSFNKLNLYLYYGNIWSPIEVSEIQEVQNELKQFLDQNFSLIYDDGKISIWASPNKIN
jgi:hypothetical protein